MNAKATDVRKLEEYYHRSGNQLVVLYGQRENQARSLIRAFSEGKKTFYYECRQAFVELQN